MYYYIIKDAKSGKVVAEGTASRLVSSGRFASENSVRTSYKGWLRRQRLGMSSGQIWERTGTPDSKPKAPAGPKNHGDRLTWRQKEARAARQEDAARAMQPPRKGYTTEQLGKQYTLPEHLPKFAQEPLPPKGDKKHPPTALQMDLYELDKFNWKRRQEGKAPIHYGKWVALGRPKA